MANNSSSSSPPFMKNVTCEYEDEYLAFYNQTKFITGLIFYPVICIVGITGNILALRVFSHRHMQTPTNVYLASLAVSDLCKLVNDAMYFIIVAIGLNDKDLAKDMMASLYPFSHYVLNMAILVTAWLTVSVAVERFVSVCMPARAKSLCTMDRAKHVSISFFVCMGLIAIPSGLKYTTKTIEDVPNNTTCVKIVRTEFGENVAFFEPWDRTQNFIRGIFPVFILLVVNVRIIFELRKERIQGKKFSARNRITWMLIVIVFMFLLCITPDAIMATFFNKGYVEEDNKTKGIREITDTLLAFNSGCSFFLYLSMSQVFRKTFLEMFCPYLLSANKGRSRPEHLPLTTKAKTEADYVNQSQTLQSSPKPSPSLCHSQIIRTNGCHDNGVEYNEREQFV